VIYITVGRGGGFVNRRAGPAATLQGGASTKHGPHKARSQGTVTVVTERDLVLR